MKRTIVFGMLIAACGLMGSFQIAAADVQVPEAVKKAFAEKYKDVTGAKWGEEKEGGKTLYEAAWNDKDGVKHEVEFDAAGTVVLVSREIKTSELPKAVTDGVEKAFPGSKVTGATLEEGKETVYEVNITDKAGKKVTLDVSPDGSKVTVDAD
jgi:uncharacterized membrane protein YkoI